MSDSSGFGKFVPGFEFLQNLAGQAAGGVAQGLGKSVPQLPSLGNWVAPTFNVEDLEKRIEELKAVHFWLDQNSKALAATIQALEVQKMTLATLQNMNFSLGDVANALKIKAVDAMASFTSGAAEAAPEHKVFAGLEIPPRTYGSAPAPAQDEAEAEEETEEETEEENVAPEAPAPTRGSKKAAAASDANGGGVIDPMQWWGALSQQFQHIASSAMKDVAKQGALDATREAASGLTEQAVKTAAGVAGKLARGVGGSVARQVGAAAGAVRAAGQAQPAAKKVAKKKTVAKQAVVKKAAPAPAAKAAASQPMGGDWPLPTAFFPGFMGTAGTAKKPAAAPAAKSGSKAASKTASKTAAKKAPARRR
jgi:hypothetical protein